MSTTLPIGLVTAYKQCKSAGKPRQAKSRKPAIKKKKHGYTRNINVCKSKPEALESQRVKKVTH